METDSTRTRADVLVVGCGAMGSAASYNLAKKGLKVLTLDRFELNHEMGSSHGQTRIIRMAYYEDPRYVPLLKRAYATWKEAEERSGRELMRETGGLMIGRLEGELVQGVLRSARLHSLPYRMLSSSEVGEEYPAFTLDEGLCAVYEQSAGILFPEECIRAFVRMAEEEGGEFRFDEKVKSWTGTSEGVEVRTSKRTYLADRLVLCAGAWNGSLLEGMLPLRCERQVPFWFSSKGRECFSPEKMPVFISEEGPGTFYYGIPDVGRGVKVARTHGGEECDPDEVRREVTREDSEPVERFVSSRLKRLGEVVASTTCLYTNTPDLNFALGVHPRDDRVTVVSACSGHGFKFASVVGEVAAEIAVEGRVPPDASFLGLDRFLG